MFVQTIHPVGYTDVVQIEIYNQNISILFCSSVKKKNNFIFLLFIFHDIIPYPLESCAFSLNAPTPYENSQQSHIDLIEEVSFIICCFHKKPFIKEKYFGT